MNAQSENTQARGEGFSKPFVFPNGQACGNFNELVAACQRNWKAAQDLLTQGKWTAFFEDLGRPDLATAARQAAQATDPERGLSDLLQKLPTDNLQMPRLVLDPATVNLSQLEPGKNDCFDIVAINQGMLLLSGTVKSSCDWLVVGETEGAGPKPFQTTTETCISVRVIGSKLRASMKPLQAELVFESNGGKVTVPVRAEIPIRPFPAGVLAGAVTPRDIAAKAKVDPAAAAGLFEQGAVLAWYQSNGWTYPIKGPASNGVAAMQQFHQFLGLPMPESTPAPAKVEEPKTPPPAVVNPVLSAPPPIIDPVPSVPPVVNSIQAMPPPGKPASVRNGKKIDISDKELMPAAVAPEQITSAPLSESRGKGMPAKKKLKEPGAAGRTASAAAAVSVAEPGQETNSNRSRKQSPLLRKLRMLPKPVLFGIFGALGGLLGALLLGELIFALVRPKAADVPPVEMAASETVTSFWGGANTFGIMIARNNFDGPVILKARDVPSAIQIPDVTIPAGSNKAELKIISDQTEPRPSPRAYEIEFEAYGPNGPLKVPSVTVKIQVEPLPARMQMTISPEVRLFEGGTNRFAVKIARQHFIGPVRLEAIDPPTGISVAPAVIDEDNDETEVEIAAKYPTKVRSFQLRMRAKCQDRPSVTVTAPIRVLVDSPPSKLTMAVSPQVTVYPGNKNVFGVKIARHWFTGPVTMEAADLPAGVKVAALVIEPNKTEGTIEVSVDPSVNTESLPRTSRLSLRAASTAVPALKAEGGVDVRIEPLPGALNIAVSPEVGVFQGGKGKFTVKVSRRSLNQPLQVNFSGAPDGVTFPAPVIPAGSNEVEIEVQADRKSATNTQKITVSASALGGPALTAKTDFKLEVKASKFKRPKVDVMFVLDVTGSMQFAINGVRDGIERFVEGLKGADVDARIGLVAFRDLIDDKNTKNKTMEVLMFQGKPFTSDFKAFRAAVAKLRADGGGDEPESSMEGVELAANQAFRSDVTKIMVLITDAPPKWLPTPAYKDFVLKRTRKAILDRKIDQLHLVVRTVDKPVYQLLQPGGKGNFYDLQQTVKNPGGFAGLLPTLSKDIVVTTTADRPDVPTASAAAPAPPPSTPVANPAAVAAPLPPESTLPNAPRAKLFDTLPPASKVEPPSAAAPTLQGVQSTQAYAESDRWQLLIAIALWTAAMAGGICFALVAGQRFYLSQAMLNLPESTKSWAGGILAGVLGGALGQFFFQITTGGELWNVVSRLCAWGLLGGILGLGMGFFVPNLKWTRGLPGGAIGGAIGAIAFALASFLLGSVLGRWIGAALVGFFIGIMVAFAEMAFRRCWLEISFGKYEVRTVSLGYAPVIVGSDPRQAMVHVEGPLTLSFRMDGERVLCKDLTSAETDEVKPGEQRKFGNVIVTVRSADQARKIGFSLELSNNTTVPLGEGLPLTAADLPGLEPQNDDTIVALVSTHPRDPKKLLLRNRSRQTWTLRKPDGSEQTVAPGGSADLAAGLKIDFGQVQGELTSDE